MTERLKNNNRSLGCISSLDLVPGSRHTTTYLGFPPGNQHSHSLQHVEDRTHCFPLNIFPLNTSQRGEPQWPHGASQRLRGHPWHLHFHLSLWSPTLKSLSPLFSQMYTYFPITSTGANFVQTSMSYSDYGNHPWKFHPPSAQRIYINPCPRHHEGQHHVKHLGAQCRTSWAPIQFSPPRRSWCSPLTLHGARMLNSLIPSNVGLGFFFAVPLLRSPRTLVGRRPLLFVLRCHLGPSVRALPQPTPLCLSVFFSYWNPATHR